MSLEEKNRADELKHISCISNLNSKVRLSISMGRLFKFCDLNQFILLQIIINMPSSEASILLS